MTKTFNGHRNWNTWNVSLWLANDEPLYRLAQFHVSRARTLDEAARALMLDLPEATPDGAPYSFTTVRLALRDFR